MKQTHERKTKGRPLGSSGYETHMSPGKRRTPVYLDTETDAWVRAQCIDRGVSFSDAAEQAFTMWLESQEIEL